MTGASRKPEAATLLARALETGGAAFAALIGSITSRDWASATFIGSRHTLDLTVADIPGVRSWLDALPEAELAVRGHLVADIAIDAVTPIDGTLQVRVTVLLIEAA